MILELGAAGVAYGAWRAVAHRWRIATQRDDAAVARAWVEWAARSGFDEHGFDTRYRGTIEGVDVVLDNGLRASGRYPVEVRLALATGEPCGTFRTGVASATTPLREAIRAVMSADRCPCKARIERDAIVLVAETDDPDRIEALIRRMLAACRPAPEPCGPYR